MGKVIFNDQKRIKNRLRVRQHRNNKKLKQMHNAQVKEKIKEQFNDFETTQFVQGNNSIEDSPDLNFQVEFKDKLRMWVINHRITRIALNDLLLILISAGFGFLPKDSRTLMATPSAVPIDILTNGKMWYYGIKKCLEYVFSDICRSTTITLDFHFDGFPISKSSNKQFWPILSAIRGSSYVH